MANPLRAALELATNEELRELTQILFARRLNPFDYLYTPHPLTVQAQDRGAWLDALENRFQFLAADGLTVLRGQANRVSYHQVLVRVCHYLKLPCDASLSVIDLESEIFLHLLQRSWQRLPATERRTLDTQVTEAIGQSPLAESLPGPWRQQPLRLLLGKGSVVAVGTVVRSLVLKQVVQQWAGRLAQEGVSQMARRGVALATARYTAVRGALTFLGPVLWGWFLAELGWSGIATNYSRIIPAVFALAQIRLLRDDGLDWATA
ncbi:MAG: hypothetical protein IGQ88_04260 [Gloeomargaritaceae cyanobacterium C42_A2020_066]|nr:hypothetical protein [Gloeomargaritaceae cyanobacterium C42_A2020_066]